MTDSATKKAGGEDQPQQDANGSDIASGSPAGFEHIFRQHFGPLVRSLSRISPDAPDAVQEAFVEAHVHWATVVDYDDPIAWVRRVAINRLLDADRRGTRQARLRDQLRQVRPPRSAPDDPSRIRQAVEQLPLRQRVAISLFYLEDLSIEQIAVAMSVSPGTIKSALHHGRRNLRRLLEVADEEDE